jgi:formate C-acetyltransferase
MNIILQYESNASSISLGRFDQYMLPFYQASLNRGRIRVSQKLLESLWVKCNDIVLLRSSSSARYFAGFPTGYTALLGGLRRPDAARSTCCRFSPGCLPERPSAAAESRRAGQRADRPPVPAQNRRKPFAWAPASANFQRRSGGPGLSQPRRLAGRCAGLCGGRLRRAVDPGRTYGLHDIAMFNLLKVMES